MTPSDNSNEMLGIYADWLEDQGYCTKELREELELLITNSWHYEYRSIGIGGGVVEVNKMGNLEELEDMALTIFKLIRNANKEAVAKIVNASKENPTPIMESYLQEALSKIEFLKSGIKTEIKNLPRAIKPIGLALHADALFMFDPEYFDFFDPNSEEGQEDFYRKQRNDPKSLLHQLTTWVFDDGDTKGALKDILHSFGKEVYKEVKRKLRNREHDT
jgi:hypothetical protein